MNRLQCIPLALPALFLLHVCVIAQTKPTIVEIPAFDGVSSSAADINEKGYVLVNIKYENGTTKPFLWKPGQFTPLTGIENGTGLRLNKYNVAMGFNWIWINHGEFRYFSGVQLRDLNDHGIVVGNTFWGPGMTEGPHAFWSDYSGNKHFLYGVPAIPQLIPGTQAFAVNNDYFADDVQFSTIVGVSGTYETSIGFRRAGMWKWIDYPFQFRLIHPIDLSNSIAMDVNSAGVIVGHGNGGSKALVWEANGTIMSPPGPDPPAPYIATRIFDDSPATILGWVNAPPVGYGVYWKRGVMHRLDDLLPENSGWTITELAGVNRKGQYVGTGIHDGKTRGFLISGDVDLVSERVEIWQSVADADINGNGLVDLVMDKEAAALVYVDAIPPETVSEPVEVEVQFGNDYPLKKTISPEDFKAIVEKKEAGDNYVVFNFVPDRSTRSPLVVRLDPQDEITETNEENNELSPVEIEVKETRVVELVYVPIDGPFITPCIPPESCYGPLYMHRFRQYMSSSSWFINETYPLRPGGVVPYETQKYYGVDTAGHLGKDLVEVAERAVTERLSSLAGIGVVPANYFRFHHEGNTTGYMVPGVKGAALVSTEYAKTAAHELGHLLGIYLWVADEEYGPGCQPLGNFVTKFDFSQKMLEEGLLCFMGCSGYPLGYWVDKPHYEHLFRELRADITDPAVLFLSGQISSDSSISITSTRAFSEGYPDVLNGGDYSLTGYSIDGSECLKTSFAAPFIARVEPGGVVPTSGTVFAFKIPYADELMRINIDLHGRVLTSFNPQSKTLADAIKRLPAGSFTPPPPDVENRRKTLLNKVDAFQKQLDGGDLREASNKLHNDIENHLNLWLIDGDYSTSPLDFTKAGVLELVDDISRRIQLALGVRKESAQPEGESNDIGLQQNSPNPFNPSTTIRYYLAEQTKVTLNVYNTLGQLVATIVDDERSAGLHEVTFDGSALTSGIYYYRIQAGKIVQTRKMLLLK